ncbi:hypothetical protein POM88_053421 [Heracleum sosnowskyi]|uniref:Uncharacterized protein n=1 Tax=Heracleum sosnowskyi TaxID=360622 RepID=A0AAD8GQC1_9APIA|nr:hypothetical protein POM88_053421 [Heracleum sosnowskyi]
MGKLRNLETLDVRTNGYLMSIPNVLWKLKKLKHLCLCNRILVRGRATKLRLEGLNELELIYEFDSSYCDAHDLFRLPNLKGFTGWIFLEENLTEENIIDFTKSRELRNTNITVWGREVNFVLLLECDCIDGLGLNGTETLSPICVVPKAYDYTGLSGHKIKVIIGVEGQDVYKVRHIPRIELDS